MAFLVDLEVDIRYNYILKGNEAMSKVIVSEITGNTIIRSVSINESNWMPKDLGIEIIYIPRNISVKSIEDVTPHWNKVQCMFKLRELLTDEEYENIRFI